MSGALTHSPADVVRHLLIDMGHGTLPSDDGNWPIYASREPDTPDRCITLYNTAGTYDGRIQFTGEAAFHYGFQVRVRHERPEDGYNKAKAIAVALSEDVSQESVDIEDITGTGTCNYTVVSVTQKTDVIDLGKDVPEGKRNIFVVNATVALMQNS